MVADRAAGLRGLSLSARTHCLALVTDAYGGLGGIAQYNRDFCGALVEGGVAVTVVPRQAPARVEVPAGLKQMAERRGKIAYVRSALRVARREPVDVVFCGHLHLAGLAWLVARLKHARLLVQTHGIEAWSRPSRMQRFATERADLVLAVSRFTRACVLAWAALPPERAVVVPDTVQDGFTPGGGSELRTRLGLDGKVVLLTVGRLDSRERYKGHDRVIAALPALLGERHPIVYLIIGEGDDRARLADLAAKHGVTNQVRFLGAVDTTTLVEAYRTADLFVMPSTGEGFGIAFLEAMASGTTTLGLAVAGARDALADGELGTTIGKSDDLASAISGLLAAPKPASAELSAATIKRFGRQAFLAQVSTALERLREAA